MPNRFRSPRLLAFTALVILGVSVAFGSLFIRQTPDVEVPLEDVGAPVESQAIVIGPQAATGRFERVAPEESGIDFLHFWKPPAKYEEMIDSSFAGGGVAIGDVDQDGLADVYLTRPFGGGRLYRNLGGWRFQDITEASGLAADKAWACGATFADVDGDADLDLFVCGYDTPNRLFVNQGQGKFVDEAQQRGLAFSGASVMMTFADYDRDGDMDGLLVTNRFVMQADTQRMKQQLAQGKKFYVKRGDRVEILPDAQELMAVFPLPGGEEVKLIQAGQFSRLYQNQGQGKYVDVTKASGLIDNGISLSATWWDYNHDGHPDLYIANDFYGADRLFHNNGNGTFKDVIKQVMPHTPWFSMGSNVADVNNDGLLDFMGSDMSGTSHYKSKIAMGDMTNDAWFMDLSDPPQVMRNTLYVNSGTDRFLEAAQLAGLGNSDWTWSLKFADFDSDGQVDLFISNGMTGDWLNSDVLQRANEEHREVRPDEVQPKRDQNLAFRNRGNLEFENVGQAWGLDEVSVAFGAAQGDLDNDGDVDLIVNNFDAPPSVFRNQLSQGHCVKFALRGTQSNRFGIDSLVTIEAGELKQAYYLTLARGFMGSDEPVVHFGLGDQQRIDKLTVRWPSGVVQTLTDLPADRSYMIHEAAESTSERLPTSAAPTMFTHTTERVLQVAHRETAYDDFVREPLLPNKLSQLGPGLAMSDINGDGLTDLFVGGAAGQQASLLLSRAGRLTPITDREGNGPFALDSASEDMGCLFLDVERDGDLDLYVVSGGVECEANAEVLRDRLYLNDGQANFTKAAPDALPDVRDSGSCVVAADFDRDGDLDLFVGSRSVPGAYPAMPTSRLLRNDSSGTEVKFSDATDQLAPELAKTGLVTGGLWSDVDDDGWLDLLVTHEWGPVKYYRNNAGQLVDQTQQAGLADRLGWWSGITGGDVDGDGDIDYAVANFGLNTKYHPSAESPVAIYYGDFENSGRYQIIEAKRHGDHWLPIRGKSCSQNAMPFIRDQFPTYHDFALADLSDIYSTDRLEHALHLEANTLESGLLINEGQGKLVFRPLPRLAQISPTFGLQFTDVDADGRLDLYLAQNFFTPQRETGRMDGGLSLLLLGQGDGNLLPVPAHRSGLVVPQDAKSLGATDLTGDGRADFVVGVNNDRLQVFENSGNQGRVLVVHLRDSAGSHSIAGARATLTFDDDTRQLSEVYFGDSYLTQTPPTLTFGLGSRTPKSIQVRWSDGEMTSQVIPDPTPAEVVVQRAAEQLKSL